MRSHGQGGMPSPAAQLYVRHCMQVRVLREACCAQDDQMGPLEAIYDVLPDATFKELVTMIVESRFLQYSASHITLQGEVGGIPVVRVFSSYYTGHRETEFIATASHQVAGIVGTSPLQFRFVF